MEIKRCCTNCGGELVELKPTIYRKISFRNLTKCKRCGKIHAYG